MTEATGACDSTRLFIRNMSYLDEEPSPSVQFRTRNYDLLNPVTPPPLWPRGGGGGCPEHSTLCELARRGPAVTVTDLSVTVTVAVVADASAVSATVAAVVQVTSTLLLLLQCDERKLSRSNLQALCVSVPSALIESLLFPQQVLKFSDQQIYARPLETV